MMLKRWAFVKNPFVDSRLVLSERRVRGEVNESSEQEQTGMVTICGEVI